jgi:DHA1 family bicyclomycin/chloramphenicol resistance-like MFS transporter
MPALSGHISRIVLQLSAIPRYPVMVLLLGALACIAPMSIDAYLPAFNAIGRAFQRPPEQVQQTLGLYMVGYSIMILFHGTLSDSFGRRIVLLVTLALYAASSLVAVAAPSFEWLLVGRIGQGLTAGAGMVVGQAIVNDCYEGPVAQKTMSYIIMVFSVSPAFAPILGGWATAALGWRSVFVLLFALSVLTFLLCYYRLPETLPAERRQVFSAKVLTHNYASVLRHKTFTAYSLAYGLMFAGFAFLIGAAPDFVTQVLKLPETAFGYVFVPLVIGLVSGSMLAARGASRLATGRLIAIGYGMMVASCTWNIAYLASTDVPAVPWAVAPIGLYSFGLALAVPSMTVTVLARVPALAGMAASVLGFIQMIFFTVCSGWLAPLVYGSAMKLALALALGVVASGAAWLAISASGAAAIKRSAARR